MALIAFTFAYLNIDKKELLEFIKQYYKDMLIIFLSIILVVIIIVYIIFEKRKKKPDISWFKKYMNTENSFEISFILWYPLNGVMISPFSDLPKEEERKILYSRKIKPLFDKHILTKGTFFSIEINEKAYDILKDFLKKNTNRMKKDDNTLLMYLKNTNFHELIKKCATYTEYDDYVEIKG